MNNKLDGNKFQNLKQPLPEIHFFVEILSISFFDKTLRRVPSNLLLLCQLKRCGRYFPVT